ncbi:hypothetical protein EYF80_051588 [Liparis tanakae]|uniref:Uncharacterized protein n=1 Tax=Liparis tanakae TaxID=230148 RepID=A0A4Z2FAL9_9TELE|nr:hypothetical protein EYF80_051588 [Liparis tanakae]
MLDINVTERSANVSYNVLGVVAGHEVGLAFLSPPNAAVTKSNRLSSIKQRGPRFAYASFQWSVFVYGSNGASSSRDTEKTFDSGGSIVEDVKRHLS